MTIDIRAHVERDVIRIVASSRRGRVGEWQTPRTPGQLEKELRQGLNGVPRPRFGRVSLCIVLESPDVQVKRLDGLPPIKTRAVLQQLVEQQASRFFLRSATNPAIVATDLVDGEAIAALFSESTVQAIAQAASGAKMRLRAIVPREVDERLAAAEAESRAPRRSVLGTRRPERGPLAWIPPARRGRETRIMRAIILLMATGLLFVAVCAKGIRAELQLRSANAVIHQLSRYEPAIDSMESELHALERVEADVARFKAGRRYGTELLGNLSTALPDSTAIVSLRADSTGAAITLLTKDVGAVVAALLEETYFASAQLQGTLVEERVASERFERATFRVRTRYSIVAAGRRP